MDNKAVIDTEITEEHNLIVKYHISDIMAYMKTHNARLVRHRFTKVSMASYLDKIEPKNLSKWYMDFLDAHPYFHTVCAGAKHHHWWEGGLEEHCTEMIGIGLDIMDLYPDINTFTRTDLIIAVFLHDFAKIWNYRKITPEDLSRPNRFHDKQVFTYVEGNNDLLNDEHKTLLELAKVGISPTEQQWSAVVFAEGGFASAHFVMGGVSTPSRTVYKKNHLATFVSMLDAFSSQILGRSLI